MLAGLVGCEVGGGPRKTGAEVVELGAVEVTDDSSLMREMKGEDSSLTLALRGDVETGVKEVFADGVGVVDVRSGRPGRKDLAT